MTRATRAGYTLVEMLVVISVNSVLMAVAVSVLATLLRSEHQGQYHCERTTALVRLAEQFRRDVASARHAEVVAGTPAAALRLRAEADSTIEYTCDGDRIRRLEYKGPSVLRREAYNLIDLSTADFLMADSNLVTIAVTFSDAARGIGESCNIDGQLAKNWRFMQAGDEP